MLAHFRWVLILWLTTWAWFSAVDAAADYKEDVGYGRLSSELGRRIPNGAGVHVTHVEALSNDKWMPNTADQQFTGKTFYDKSTEHMEGYSAYYVDQR